MEEELAETEKQFKGLRQSFEKREDEIIATKEQVAQLQTESLQRRLHRWGSQIVRNFSKWTRLQELLAKKVHKLPNEIDVDSDGNTPSGDPGVGGQGQPGATPGGVKRECDILLSE
eukprot:1005853-Pyramimonas_sp.AAC.1